MIRFLVNIDTRHLLDLAWMKGNGATVIVATDFFNRLSFLIASEILSVKASRKKKKERAHLLAHFISTAEVFILFFYLNKGVKTKQNKKMMEFQHQKKTP